MTTVLWVTAALLTGALLTRLYDRSPWARRLVFWIFGGGR